MVKANYAGFVASTLHAVDSAELRTESLPFSGIEISRYTWNARPRMDSSFSHVISTRPVLRHGSLFEKTRRHYLWARLRKTLCNITNSSQQHESKKEGGGLRQQRKPHEILKQRLTRWSRRKSGKRNTAFTSPDSRTPAPLSPRLREFPSFCLLFEETKSGPTSPAG